MSCLVCFQYLLFMQRFIQKCWIVYYSAWLVSGSTQLFLVWPTVPTLVPLFLSLRYLQFFLFLIKNPFYGWQLTEFLYKASWLPLHLQFAGDIWRGDPLSRALPLHQCYRILGRTPGGQLSISSKSIWEPNIMTWFWSSQGGWYIWHLWHLQPRLPWSRGTWSPWSPYHCRHYFCPASQK